MRIHHGTSWKERTSKDVNSDKSFKKEINSRGGDSKKGEENDEWIQLISSNISNIFGRLGIYLCVSRRQCGDETVHSRVLSIFEIYEL